MKAYRYLIPLFLILVSCQEKPTFIVKGHIGQAAGSVLYLEHAALLQTSKVDSCILNEDGAFSLQASAPTYPDFYRLRIGKQVLLLAIDSTEEVTITTCLDSFSNTLSIEGSDQSLSIAQLRATARQASVETLREHAQQIIINNPRSLAAYYAVFFKQDGKYIWNIYNKSDRRMYQAVATSFHTWMPNYERTIAIYTQVSDVMQAERTAQQQIAVKDMIEQAENAFLDISLLDDSNANQSLSNLKGKVIVLDFSAIEMEQSQGYIFELRNLYNQYSQRGLTIYSISLDRNKLLWEDGVANLPWVNVYAGDKAMEVLSLYNVHTLPTLFLFDRQGNVQGRYTDFKALEADIKKYL